MSIQIRTGVIRVEVGDNKPLYDTHLIETSYWNRTNINCFEDRCTNRYAKDAVSRLIKMHICFICDIFTNEETRTLMP